MVLIDHTPYRGPTTAGAKHQELSMQQHFNKLQIYNRNRLPQKTGRPKY